MLRIALALTGSFLIVKLLAARYTRSLALLSDAAHMFTDAAAAARCGFKQAGLCKAGRSNGLMPIARC